MNPKVDPLGTQSVDDALVLAKRSKNRRQRWRPVPPGAITLNIGGEATDQRNAKNARCRGDNKTASQASRLQWMKAKVAAGRRRTEPRSGDG